jgi:decaprenyl-phosphate phosphoribosyltransferase
MRPRQWVKNVLVAAAPGAAGVLDQRTALVHTVLAFVAFSLAASGTYLMNDAADVESDRAHPTKRNRPIANGTVPVRVAWVAGVVLLLAGIGVACIADWRAGLVIAGYTAMTTAYSLGLKRIAVVDLLAVASGFVLRAVAGAVATDVPISDWFYIITSFGSLFMVAGKRHAERLELGEEAASIRSVLGEYTAGFLVYLRAVSSGATLVAYCLLAFEKADVADGGFPWYQLSIVPFTIGILRYALLLEQGRGGAPEELVLGDRVLQVAGALWALAFAIGVYTL